MKAINPITMSIIRKARDGDTISKVSERTGFAYSAVYRWVKALESLGVLELKNKGNRTEVYVNREAVYRKFMELGEALGEAERNMVFWRIMKGSRFRARFVKGTAAAIWTHGGYITGDFYDRIYHVEVLERDEKGFKTRLARQGIPFGKENELPGKGRPFVCIKAVSSLEIEWKSSLPVTPLKELVSWCRRLHLDPILEQLDSMYGLGLKAKHAEVYVNV